LSLNLKWRQSVLPAAFFSLVLAAVPPAARAAAPSPDNAPAEPGEAAASSSSPPAAPSAAEAGLKERAKNFYGFLRGRQVNIFSVYQNDAFRSYFSAEEVLENYISYLTARLGERKFRKHRIQRTELERVKQTGPDRATARVKLVGRHKDLLFFWDKTVTIEDEWRKLGGEWYVFPPPF